MLVEIKTFNKRSKSKIFIFEVHCWITDTSSRYQVYVMNTQENPTFYREMFGLQGYSLFYFGSEAEIIDTHIDC